MLRVKVNSFRITGMEPEGPEISAVLYQLANAVRIQRLRTDRDEDH